MSCNWNESNFETLWHRFAVLSLAAAAAGASRELSAHRSTHGDTDAGADNVFMVQYHAFLYV